MKKHHGWSYSPYQPLLCKNNLYICRVVPQATSIHLEWLSTDESPVTVYWKQKDLTAWLHSSVRSKNEYTIEGLEQNADYIFYIETQGKQSAHRLARTGAVHGTVVNYLHPDDHVYRFSGQYLCSPCLIRHPDGFLLASMDVYQYDAPQNLTLIFRSDDDGSTWHYVSELFPCFWGRMFIHRGVLYMLGCSTEYGDLLIGASYDGGKSFTEPTLLFRGSNGKKQMPGLHKNPQPVIEFNGRLYNTIEWGSWGAWAYAAMVFSADVNADLLDANSWHFSEPLPYNENWQGVAHGPSAGCIEGCLTVGKDGQLYSVMRYDMDKTQEPYGMVLRYRINTKDPDAPMEFDRAITFPANNSKFQIRYDEVSKKYFSIASRLTSTEGRKARTLLSLMVSDDMLTWTTLKDLIDERAADPDGKKIGFQYVDFFFEGDDILFLCRTAMNNASNYHDSNYSCFHRIPQFRNLLTPHS